MAFSSLLGAIGLAAVKAEIRAAGRRIAVAAISSLLLVIAVCFAVAALAVWLAGEIGTIGALLAMACGFLVLALIVQAIARLTADRRRYRPRPAPPSPPPSEPILANGTIPPGSEIGAVTVVALLGFLLARLMLQR